MVEYSYGYGRQVIQPHAKISKSAGDRLKIEITHLYQQRVAG